MTREEQIKELWEKAYKHLPQDCSNQLTLEEICCMFFELGWRAADENPKTIYVVVRQEEHDDYVEKVFADKSKADSYCRQFVNNPNEYNRYATEMEVTL